MNPLNAASRFLVDRIADVANAAATRVGGGNRTRAMLAARRGINVLPLPGSGAERQAVLDNPALSPSVAYRLKNNFISGGFVPGDRQTSNIGTAIYPEGNNALRDHEINHGYWEAAVRDPTDMPAFMRWLVGRVKEAAPGDEYRKAEATRNLFNEIAAQMRGGRNFTDIPAETYARLHANNPELAEAYRAFGRFQAGAEGMAGGAIGGVLGASAGLGIDTLGGLLDDSEM